MPPTARPGYTRAPTASVVEWVRELEYDRLKLPKPDAQVLLAVPVELAAARADNRARQEADRAKDAYERDDGLQRRTGEVYAALAADDWCGRWSRAPRGRRRGARSRADVNHLAKRADRESAPSSRRIAI